MEEKSFARLFFSFTDRLHERFRLGIEWNMRNRRPYLFLAAYFLVIFLWLFFCYRQVQKACLQAGHTVKRSALEVVPLPEVQTAERANKGTSFWGEKNKNTESFFEKKNGADLGRTEEGITGQEKNDTERTGIAGESENTPEGGQSSGREQSADAETIRVVLLGADGLYHKKIFLEADGEKLEIAPDSPYFAKTAVIRISITDKENGKIQVVSLDKACGHPSYRGALEIRKEEEGLVLINEVSLEEYVKGVLPSEMPAAYPLEALKAQAVCARTYAKMKQESKTYPQYDAAVDDSTACQVYRNLDTAPQGDQAVEETAGEVLQKEDGSFVECYYYSTSCGRGTQMSVWHGGETDRPMLTGSEDEITLMNQEFFDYIRNRYEEHSEVSEAFYRWEYRCEKAADRTVFARCTARQAVNNRLVWAQDNENGKDLAINREALGNIKDMSIAERKEGGVADCMRIICAKGTVYVWGEYNIRYVLAQGGEVKLLNDTAYQAKELLPSAFISLQSICNEKGNMIGYIVVGGGFGHGVGMSQNGAKQMALAGSGYREILDAYYKR